MTLENCPNIMQKWTGEVSLLANIAVIESRNVYGCYMGGYQRVVDAEEFDIIMFGSPRAPE